jgi:hypothetical protein
MKGLRRFFQFIFIMLTAGLVIVMITGGSSYLGRLWFPRDPSAGHLISLGMLIIVMGITYALGEKK